MSSNRAPDNMPTKVLRRMIGFAEQQAADWANSAEDYRRRLGVAERATERYSADVERYNEQLQTRLKEEAEG